MLLINNLIVYFKRILHKKMYLGMLLLILVLTITYNALPSKSKSADIRVLLYSEDDPSYSDPLIDSLVQSASVYTFERASSPEEIINSVKRGDAECGYVIHENFFKDYIVGDTTGGKITQYTSPSTTLAKPIDETVFSHIFRVCSYDILCEAAEMPEYNDELKAYLDGYINSDQVFTLEDTTNGEYTLKDMVYKVNIPIFEICTIVILFAALLGLLSHLEDSEKGYFIALSSSTTLMIKNVCLFTSIVPITIVSAITLAFSGFTLHKLMLIVLFSIICHIITFILSYIIKKSTLLIKVLPIVMFVFSALVFAKEFI